MPRYDAARIEPKWQRYWDEHATFRVEMDPAKPKLYVLDMFPYPSGDGLHVGHPEGYTATDIVCRYSRMRGKNVLHPMGWDAFGLPAEQHAIKTGTHPRITTDQNIATFKRQLKMLGFSYDWSRELATTDPEYVRWTQWIFLQLFDTWYDPDHRWTGPDGKERVGKGRPISELPIPNDVRAAGDLAVRRYRDSHRLAYLHEAPVNWCPALGTVLANEEVTADGRSERGHHPVERRHLKQWMLRITAYAERLMTELDDLNWPESIKLLQRNWIGRSEGAEVDFLVERRASMAEGQKSSVSSAKGEACFMAAPAEGGNGEGLPSAASNKDTPPTPPWAGGAEEWKAGRAQSGFPREPEPGVIRVYTTRPDTLFGVTYMVLAPEHPLVDQITTPEQAAAVAAYRQQAALKSDLDRTDLAKVKTGVFTGGYAINPVNGERVPVWIADYVLISYGTGAIMAVPGHDERDFEFAQQYGIEIRPVVLAPGESPEVGCFVGEGTAINSGAYNGLSTREFKARITADLAAQGLGKKAVNYRLRDWLFSRQRYWGEPFPIWHELDASGQPTGLVRAVDENDLPVRLPEMEDFQPTGSPEPLLSKAPAEWLYATAADGTKLKRETNSMPQWAGSCWYYLRFCDNKNHERFIDPVKEKYWLPVDLYIGGAEHAVLHLLYSRFWHKVLFDRGHVSHPEPFARLVNQGMILGEMEFTAYRVIESRESSVENQTISAPPAKEGAASIAPPAKRGNGGDLPSSTSNKDTPLRPLAGEAKNTWISARDVNEDSATTTDGRTVEAIRLTADQVEKKGDAWVLKDDPSIVVDARSFKMSKSRGNVINPDTVVKEYGADALRMYEMFMGPLEATKPWSMAGVDGVYRFLGRVWRLVADDRADDVRLSSAVQDVPPTPEQLRVLHKTIRAVTDDIEKLSFNTAISRMMEFTNEFTSYDVRPKAALEPFVLLLSPFAPHLAEELWELLGHSQSLAYEPWPVYDAALLEEATIEVPVQVNGKLRGKVTVAKDAVQAAVESAAKADAAVAQNLAGKTIVKTIFVPGKLLNFVVK